MHLFYYAHVASNTFAHLVQKTRCAASASSRPPYQVVWLCLPAPTHYCEGYFVASFRCLASRTRARIPLYSSLKSSSLNSGRCSVLVPSLCSKGSWNLDMQPRSMASSNTRFSAELWQLITLALGTRPIALIRSASNLVSTALSMRSTL
jgi:hypothetical protein